MVIAFKPILCIFYMEDLNTKSTMNLVWFKTKGSCLFQPVKCPCYMVTSLVLGTCGTPPINVVVALKSILDQVQGSYHPRGKTN